MGTDCSTSRIGIKTASALRLLAASVAYVNVKISDATKAANIRMMVRSVYSGSAKGESEIPS